MEMRVSWTQMPRSPGHVFSDDPSHRTMVQGHSGKTEHPGPERAVNGAGIVCVELYIDRF
jgi:hypothetical protein